MPPSSLLGELFEKHFANMWISLSSILFVITLRVDASGKVSLFTISTLCQPILSHSRHTCCSTFTLGHSLPLTLRCEPWFLNLQQRKESSCRSRRGRALLYNLLEKRSYLICRFLGSLQKISLCRALGAGRDAKRLRDSRPVRCQPGDSRNPWDQSCCRRRWRLRKDIAAHGLCKRRLPQGKPCLSTGLLPPIIRLLFAILYPAQGKLSNFQSGIGLLLFLLPWGYRSGNL